MIAVVTRDDALQELLDKQAIYEVVARFMRACDRGDPDDLRTCYHPGAIEDHAGGYVGDAQAWIDTIVPTLTHPKTLMTHVLTNVLIEVRGDVASSEAYVTTTGRRPIEGELLDVQTLARCIDRFERRDGEWRIAHRTLVMEWCTERPTSESWGKGTISKDPSKLKRGLKFPADPIYHVFDGPA